MQAQHRQLKGEHTDTGTQHFKSGLLKVFKTKKKFEVALLHEFYYLGQNGKSPHYEELSPFQFVFGHTGCIQEVADQQVKDDMLEYLKLLMLDAIKTNWGTVKGADSVQLQTMEQG